MAHFFCRTRACLHAAHSPFHVRRQIISRNLALQVIETESDLFSAVDKKGAEKDADDEEQTDYCWYSSFLEIPIAFPRDDHEL